MAKRRVVLDTSFLIACAEAKIDYFSELERVLAFAYELVVPEKALLELQRTAAQRKKEAVAIARTLLKKKKVAVLEGNGRSVDEIILGLVKEDKTIVVATIDAALRRRLKLRGVDTVVVRQRKYLDFQKA